MMKDSDKAIEKVLAGLREAETPEGMEQRILKRLRNITTEQHGRSPRRIASTLRLIRMPFWALATASVAVVSLAVCWAVFRQHRAAHNIADSNKHTVVANAPSTKIQVAAQSEAVPLHGSATVRVKPNANSRNRQLVKEEESVALDEMHAASYPAPPMPLTEQEKLLLRISHKRDPVEFAALDPVLRAERNAEEKAEVQRFFEPPKMGNNE
jgi:hypothetical protein